MHQWNITTYDVLSFTYDTLGRKIGQSDLDSDATSYEYNALGEAGIAKRKRARIERELRAIDGKHGHPAYIGSFLFPPKFPMDIHPSAKIGREALTRWAAGKLW